MDKTVEEESLCDSKRDSLVLENSFEDEKSEGESDDFLSRDIREIKQLLLDLQATFNEKIETDAHKNMMFDNMHSELVKYQNGVIDKIINTIALDIIQLTDAVKGYYRVYEEKDPTEENYQRLLKIVKGISEDLQDILYRQNIESYYVTGQEVDVRRQKIIQIIETDDISMDNKVALHVADGYEKDEKVIRPERIKIFKYVPRT